MGRYQFELDQMRKECKEQFGSTQSGSCTFCGKYIQQNLGRHVVCYHMDLAQLWRCPVTWCTVWKGTPQDCIDHMRKAHNVLALANLARWFPPWTVSREYWTNIMRSDVSGIAVDTSLFSRIGVPLFHRYQVFSQSGTHVAFRGSYMQGIRMFLEESDAVLLRTHRHRHRAREIVARMSRMSRTTLQEVGDREPDSSSRPRNVSSVWAAGPEVYPSSCCCCPIGVLRSFTFSSIQSTVHSGADGLGASEVRLPGGAVGATVHIVDCYD